MDIVLDNVGKRYRFDWIFRNVSYHFKSGHKYAITGPNGSGKSTFLKVLCGYLSPSKGKVHFKNQDKEIAIDDVYQSMSYSAPYIELIEEFTLKEALQFHMNFKPIYKGIGLEDLITLVDLKKSRNKEIRFFSSGMKQRVKLLLSICSVSEVLLLDEPTTNLDEKGAAWYQDIMKEFAMDRTIIVASNVASDFQFCEERLDITNFKKKKANKG